MSQHSTIPTTGNLGTNWPRSHVLTQGKGGSLSSAGWTEGNEGFPQQTFLGASIRTFNINAGFGDSASTLSVQLVNDEFNTSDGTSLGLGDDPYHGGTTDFFRPPVVGTPVYFTFGKNHADVEQAYRQTFDSLYNVSTIPSEDEYPTYTTTGEITSVPAGHYLRSSTGTGNSKTNTWVNKNSLSDPNNASRGKDHFVFGGILQSYTQNKGPGGSPLYSVQVTDPREILQNATVLLNNYQGTTFNNKNLFNVYGFLEYDPSEALKASLASQALSVSTLTKQVDDAGNVAYVGDDTYRYPPKLPFTISILPQYFPITGQGFSRRSDKGIPWYRVYQGLAALFESDGFLPQEYVNAGFGGTVDFRGFKYIVDFSGIPLHLIPQMYYMDFDQLDLLSLAQELCDVLSHELYVTLLPVIDHPGCEFLYNRNNYFISQGQPQNIIAGIIRVDAINKSVQPQYGAIKSYIDALSVRGVNVENQDVGFELANVTTDKFVVGAQEVEMYYFSGDKDRDNLELRKKNTGTSNNYERMQGKQWSLETSLQQQILPFYGFLGEKAVTIPRGFGSYQQIMLDATNLTAHGVGNYYIATELELRAALVSYKQWSNFLTNYNEVYIQELTQNQGFFGSLSSTIDKVISGLNDRVGDNAKEQLSNLSNREFGVSVPRCVFNSDKDYMGADGYPASPCAPPYGYPLYYKRAEKIGIPEAGLTNIQTSVTTVISNIGSLESKIDSGASYLKKKEDNAQKEIIKIQNKMAEDRMSFDIANGDGSYDQLTDEWLFGPVPEGVANTDWEPTNESKQKLLIALEKAQEYADSIRTEFIEMDEKDRALLATYRTDLMGHKGLIKNLSRNAKDHLKNARKVYNFVKQVAEENLGKKFLVKIPKVSNPNYSSNIVLRGDLATMDIKSGPFGFRPVPIGANQGDTYGALRCNFDPISEKWQYNYKPEPQGGFFNFALYNKNLSSAESANVPAGSVPPATLQMLAPMDLTNMLSNGNRVHCYARFNHSQYLDFQGVSKSSMTQQAITAGGFIPDIMEEMPNLDPDKSLNLDQIQARLQSDSTLERQMPSVAYVKCDVDEDLYMAPMIGEGSVKTWATNYTVDIVEAPAELIEGKDSKGCPEPKFAKRKLNPSFSVPVGGAPGGRVKNTDFLRYPDANMNGNIVSTELYNLDPNSVYAIVTVPGKIVPSVDSRYLDGPLHAFNTVKLKNILTQDVVKGVPGFNKPPYITNKKRTIDCSKAEFSFNDYADAMRAQRDILKGKAMDESLIAFASPSPVYPDLIALPMMSMERCYGPWNSASIIDGDPRVRYSDIGGKIEFVKDENLAPWNFAGYQLMNEAGLLQAQFSNSLLLFSERGGFVFPDAPVGMALARSLQAGGPLITSIAVNVGDSIKTTVKMDLYTSSFGKLQKQKEGNIATIARERQKIIDRNNNAIRRGLGKAASNNNLMGGLLANGGQRIIDAAKGGQMYFSEFEKQEVKKANMVMFSTVVDEIETTEGSRRRPRTSMIIANDEEVGEMLAGESEGIAFNRTYDRSAGGPLPIVGANMSPSRGQGMPAQDYNPGPMRLQIRLAND